MQAFQYNVLDMFGLGDEQYHSLLAKEVAPCLVPPAALFGGCLVTLIVALSVPALTIWPVTVPVGAIAMGAFAILAKVKFEIDAVQKQDPRQRHEKTALVSIKSSNGVVELTLNKFDNPEWGFEDQLTYQERIRNAQTVMTSEVGQRNVAAFVKRVGRHEDEFKFELRGFTDKILAKLFKKKS